MSTDKPSRKTLAEIAASRPEADLARIDTATEEEIARCEREDGGEAAFDWSGARAVARPPLPDVRGIRLQLGMTRDVFAKSFGLDLRAIEAWEQHRREPDRAARVLLAVIAHAPDAVRRALANLAA